MILPWGEALGEGRSLDDVLSNRAIPLWVGESDVLITCYEWNAKVREQRGIE